MGLFSPFWREDDLRPAPLLHRRSKRLGTGSSPGLSAATRTRSRCCPASFARAAPTGKLIDTATLADPAECTPKTGAGFRCSTAVSCHVGAASDCRLRIVLDRFYPSTMRHRELFFKLRLRTMCRSFACCAHAQPRLRSHCNRRDACKKWLMR